MPSRPPRGIQLFAAFGFLFVLPLVAFWITLVLPYGIAEGATQAAFALDALLPRSWGFLLEQATFWGTLFPVAVLLVGFVCAASIALWRGKPWARLFLHPVWVVGGLVVLADVASDAAWRRWLGIAKDLAWLAICVAVLAYLSRRDVRASFHRA